VFVFVFVFVMEWNGGCVRAVIVMMMKEEQCKNDGPCMLRSKL
jgi:hypothetical protein